MYKFCQMYKKIVNKFYSITKNVKCILVKCIKFVKCIKNSEMYKLYSQITKMKCLKIGLN